MSVKRFVMASIAVFITFQVLDFLIHSIILMPTYNELKHIWRPDMMSKMWIMHVASLLLSFLFVYIFIKGYENKGLMEGVRFGVTIGILMNVVVILNQYVVYPVPFSLAAQWMAYGMAEFIVCGAITALVYNEDEAS